MRHALQLHPDSRCEAVDRIEVEAARPHRHELVLHYFLSGRTGELALPVAASGRADGLWQSTCFEAFLHLPSGGAYREFNFAPSGQWVAYRFSGYREGMASLELPSLAIATRCEPDRLELRVSLSPGAGVEDMPWCLGLCAVIEEANGRKSYWAAAHPPGKADFHHHDSFVCELP